MAQKYLNPHKKFISRTLMKEELKLKEKEFDELVTIMGLYPYIPKEKQKIDRIPDFFYRMSDYEKLKKSSVLRIFKKNNNKMAKKDKYTKQGLHLRAEKISEREYYYVGLVKNRFKSFGHALDELGNSLTNLSLSNKLKLDDGISQELEEFKKFVIENGFLKYVFMSNKGFYYEVNVKHMRIIWLNPYNGKNLEEVTKIIKDEPLPFRWSTYNCLHFASESVESEPEDIEMKVVNKIDVSLLSFGIPFQKYHLKLVLHKLKQSYTNLMDKKRLFEGKRFFIACENLAEDLNFIIFAFSGIVVTDLSFDYCLGDVFDEIIDGKIYLHPQYILDCINKNTLLDVKHYTIGKKIPRHESPFKLDNFITPEISSSLSKRKRNKLQNIIDGFEDVHYRENVV